MSGPRETTPWLDRWWPLLVVLFGFSGLLFFALWHPSY